MNLFLKTKLRLKDLPDGQALVELIQMEFPEGHFQVSKGNGICTFGLNLDVKINPRQKQLFIDVFKELDKFLLETVYINGRVGDEVMAGYMGPSRKQKEKSRAKLEQIQISLEQLLPEHRAALKAFLSTD